MTNDENKSFDYADEAKKRWGHTEAYKQSVERVGRLTKEDFDKIKLESENLINRIVANRGKGPESDEIQQLIAEHYNNLRHFYEPNLEMYAELGRMYVEDSRFGAYFEKFSSGLAKFMCDAINIFCEKNKKISV